nr:hypothetical protein [Listeria rocourtiae]
MIKIADHIVDIGPHAGKNGGQIMLEGNYEDLLQSDTLTGKHMNNKTEIKAVVRKASSGLPVIQSSLHNLQNVRVSIPKDILTVVTGVAGSGKSTLINQVFLKENPDAIVIDQSAAHANVRSNSATYTGIMDTIRKLFGEANQVSPSLFSYNSKGACPECKGLGVVAMDLAFMEAIRTPCEVCRGKRFQEEVLQYKVADKSISDVLEMTVFESLDFFQLKKITKKLEAIAMLALVILRWAIAEHAIRRGMSTVKTCQ